MIFHWGFDTSRYIKTVLPLPANMTITYETARAQRIVIMTGRHNGHRLAWLTASINGETAMIRHMSNLRYEVKRTSSSGVLQ